MNRFYNNFNSNINIPDFKTNNVYYPRREVNLKSSINSLNKGLDTISSLLPLISKAKPLINQSKSFIDNTKKYFNKKKSPQKVERNYHYEEVNIEKENNYRKNHQDSKIYFN